MDLIKTVGTISKVICFMLGHFLWPPPLLSGPRTIFYFFIFEPFPYLIFAAITAKVVYLCKFKSKIFKHWIILRIYNSKCRIIYFSNDNRLYLGSIASFTFTHIIYYNWDKVLYLFYRKIQTFIEAQLGTLIHK